MGTKRKAMPDPAQQPSGEPVAKRSRASKPKVKTGCLTCKIRRVKCDEAKPSCVRCTSTGRKCDGYSKAAPPVKQRAAESLRGLAAARQEFLESYYHKSASAHQNVIAPLSESHNIHINPAFHRNTNPLLRPIAADIPGTETERRFFHAFRTHPGVARDGLTLHVHNISPFWRRLVPQLSHQDPAVKHALVALGAQYWLFEHGQKDGLESSPRFGGSRDCAAGDGSCISHADGPTSPAAIDTFVVQQYNRSMSRLARLVAEASPPSSTSSTPSPDKDGNATTSDFENTQRLALVCCLVFICIETLRGNREAAVTHLANGVRIIAEALPDEAIAFLAEEGDDEIHDDERTTKDTEHSGETETEMREIIRIFVRLEMSAVCFNGTFKPLVELKVNRLVRERKQRRQQRQHTLQTLLPPPRPTINPPSSLSSQWTSLDLLPPPPTIPDPDFPTLHAAHVASTFLIRHLVARSYEVRAHYGDVAFWSQPEQQAQQAALLARLSRLDVRLRRFRERYLALGSERQLAEKMSAWMDWMHLNTARAMVSVMTGLQSVGGEFVPIEQVPQAVEEILRETVDVARILQEAIGAAAAAGVKRDGEDKQRAPPRFTYDMVLVGPMYNVAVTTSDPALRREALRLLRENTTREAFWEANVIEQLVEQMNRVVEEGRLPDLYVPKSLGSFGAIPDIMGTLEGMSIEDKVEGQSGR